MKLNDETLIYKHTIDYIQKNKDFYSQKEIYKSLKNSNVPLDIIKKAFNLEKDNLPKPKFSSHNVIIVTKEDNVDTEKLIECYNCNMKLLIQDEKKELICHNCNVEFEIKDSENNLENLTKLQKIIIREREKGKKLTETMKYLEKIGFKEKDFKTILYNIFNKEND